MNCVARPLRTCLALLALFAQLCLPLAHAAMLAQPAGQMASWCGDPARARAFIAELPAELRQAFDQDGTSVDHLDTCAKLCAVAATPPPLPALAPTVALRAAGLEPLPVGCTVPAARTPALKPPSQGPPRCV